MDESGPQGLKRSSEPITFPISVNRMPPARGGQAAGTNSVAGIMISSCHRCALLGFTASALLHVGVAFAIFWTEKTQQASPHPERRVAVSLAMFAEPIGLDPPPADVTQFGGRTPIPAPVLEPAPGPTSEPVPAREPSQQPETESVPQPELEFVANPEPVPRSTRIPESAPQSGPEPELHTNPESKAKSQSSPRGEPKAEQKSKPTFATKTKPQLKPKPKSKSEPSRKTLAPRAPARGRSGKTKPKTQIGGMGRSAQGGGKEHGAKSKPLEKQYLAGLQHAIAKKRRYPSLARRRGETGVVAVSFVLAKSGRISGARVDKSSGSHTLDKAALETLKRLGRYKPIPKSIGRTSWQLRVPIRFSLN